MSTWPCRRTGGANTGRKVASLVAGMLAGADSIDDMVLLRYGAMGRVFDWSYAPSTHKMNAETTVVRTVPTHEASRAGSAARTGRR